jgi:hypothetical protein
MMINVTGNVSLYKRETPADSASEESGGVIL